MVRWHLSQLAAWGAEKVDRSIGWSRLPTVLGISVLIGMGMHPRAKNLYDTGAGKLTNRVPPTPARRTCAPPAPSTAPITTSTTR